MRVLNGIDELRGAVGEHLGYSAWHQISQGQIDAFADVTEDHQWIHVDVARASNGPFGSTVAHGFLTLSLVPKLVAEIYRVDGIAMAVNYGANRLRFPSPVPAGSRIRAGVRLDGVEPNSLGYQVQTQVVIEREGADKPVCVVESLAIVAP